MPDDDSQKITELVADAVHDVITEHGPFNRFHIINGFGLQLASEMAMAADHDTQKATNVA